MTNNLDTLVARADAASASSRQLDADIFRYLSGRANGSILWTEVPPYTESVDAALALAERILPGAAIDMTTGNCHWDGRARVDLIEIKEGNATRSADGEGLTLPIAIVSAALKSLAKQPLQADGSSPLAD